VGRFLQRWIEVALVLASVACSFPSSVDAQARPAAERPSTASRRGARTRSPTPAAAVSDAERARTLLGRADFERALVAADAAEAGTLDRDGLIALLETRVLIEAGLGRQEDVDRDLARLVAIEPARPAPASFPPPIVQRLERARASAVAVSVDVEVETSAAGATLTARNSTAPQGLVRSLRVTARVGDAAWQTSDEGTLTVAVEEGDVLSYYAQVLGPGGAVLATAGTEAEPRTRARAPRRAVTPLPAPVTSSGDSSADDTPLFVGLGVGGGVLVLGVVIAIVAVSTSSNDSTLVTLPMER
jgi:hypothetical protein